MMIASWTVVLSALVYLCLLFGVAHWGDGAGRRLVTRRARAPIYALALGVYCTSWTFFGSVGLASRGGFDFLTIYLGPILAIGCCHPLLVRVVTLAKAHNSTSIADFVATRYGKSERVAAIVSLVALAGSLPYLSLQLKAVSSSLEILLAGTAGGSASLPFGDLTLAVALVLAGFALAFGTRHSDATEHQSGLVLAIAAESLVKLAAFLTVGIFVLLATGHADMSHSMAVWRSTGSAWPVANGWYFVVMTLLAAFASLLLPRQFHMAVIENRNIGDLRTAAWLFPLYLVAMGLFVAPLAAAGLTGLPAGSVDPDLTVLALPLRLGSGAVALLAFLGGLSAATAMVIVETIAVAIMVSNHLVMPLVLRGYGLNRAGSDEGRVDLGRVLVGIRRVAIVCVTLLAYAYYRVADDAEFAAIGFLSFAAVAQIAPAFIGGLLWRRGTALGASAGLVVGMATWTVTLFLPSIGADDALRASVGGLPLLDGILRPGGIGLAEVTSGAVWSLALNTLAYVLLSFARPVTAVERRQASAFVLDASTTSVSALRFFRARVTVDELRRAVGRYLGEERTHRSFAQFARARGVTLAGEAEADSHLLRYAEHLLSSAIGAASSRLALSLVLRRRNLSRRAALKLLDDASAAMQQNRDLLQHALDHAQQGITVTDRDRFLLSWNQAFIDLFDLPPDMIRVGTRLDDILRLNAERGIYGPGSPDSLVARRLHSLLNDPGPVRMRLQPTGRVMSVRANHLPEGGYFTTYTDVTEIADEEEALELAKVTLEQRVQERTEELTRLNEQLSDAKRQAEDANVSKTRFLAATSHDILQPLNAARLYATSLVERTREGGAAAETALAENIDASLDAVEEILTTILDISRFDTGAMQLQPTTFRIDELFRQLAREFTPVADAKGLRLLFMPTSLAVRTDRRLLRRLLQNLVSNALKYTPRGRVLVGVRRRGDDLVLAVFDTGLGIPAAQQTTVFTEFRRLSEGARAAPGLGLGLSIVERIARALGTRVALQSDPGRGSVFSVALPRVVGAPALPALPRPARRSTVPLMNLNVLALDNEPAILDGMRILLEGWGCHVDCARNLPDALAALERDGDRPIHVLIADYHLDEGRNGLDAIAILRERTGSDLPAVLVTADHSVSLRTLADERGINLLNKPLKPAALRALLTQWRATRMAAE